MAVILLVGLTVSMLLMRFFASAVTVSHSGDGYCGGRVVVTGEEWRLYGGCGDGGGR